MKYNPHFLQKNPAFLLYRTMKPGEIKYECHWSDDTAHDFVFLQKVLEDIFADRCIKFETALIKSYIVPIQCKNKCFFNSVQQFNAAGHNKSLIDSMLTFGCNSILRRERCYRKQWFSTSEEICDYLTLRRDNSMGDDDYQADHSDVITRYLFLPFKDWTNPYKAQKNVVSSQF